MAKRRSKKQLANDKRLGRMAKSRGKSKKSKSPVKKKSITRRSSKVAKKKNQSNVLNNILKNVMPIVAPIGYGFIREKASDALAQTAFVKGLPVTNFTDEAVMLGANWGLRKLGLGKIPGVSSVLRSQKNIELGRVGQTLADMRIGRTNGTGKLAVFIN